MSESFTGKRYRSDGTGNIFEYSPPGERWCPGWKRIGAMDCHIKEPGQNDWDVIVMNAMTAATVARLLEEKADQQPIG